MRESAFPYQFKYPNDSSESEYGISKRLYIATTLFAAMIASGNLDGNTSDEQHVKVCYEGADELIKQDK